ncbi:hypothetical protein BD410DRAFT_841993 [Rickenella mellea]|uniref:Uncharacterized protein n=1 Tax=Rickenella mellea TaxID=50990 RepID=A0A4Y7PXA3_9AGAM|nr:hypothetical protein BD410DRAFT_841993 [Rickenella mellea]
MCSFIRGWLIFHRFGAKKRKKSANVPRSRQTLCSCNSFEILTVDKESDNDPDFASDDVSKPDTSASENSDVEELTVVTNEELANLLPSKTAPFPGARKTGKKTTTTGAKPKRKRMEKEMECTPVTGAPSAPTAETSTGSTTVNDPIPESVTLEPSSSGIPAKKSSEKHNPIYHFYENVPNNAEGKPGQDGDKHYRCYHGSRKIFTITKAMCTSLNGLIGHLKTTFPLHYRLYKVLKARNGPPTMEELLFAANKKTMDASVAATYLQSLEHASNNLVKAFEKQSNNAAQKAMGKWDQSKFENLLVDWLAGNDQPFEEVERPEFTALLEYTHC